MLDNLTIYKANITFNSKCSLSSIKRIWNLPSIMYLPIASSILKEFMTALEAVAEETIKLAAAYVGVNSPTGLLSSPRNDPRLGSPRGRGKPGAGLCQNPHRLLLLFCIHFCKGF